MKIKIFKDESYLANAAAELFVSQYQAAIQTQAYFNVCLSGGSTPKRTFEILATDRFKKQISWSKIQVFWGDERWVAPDQSESNYHMAWESLLKHVNIPESNIHRFKTELSSPDAIVIDYIKEVKNISHFDFVFLGLGEDGHIASLFPDADLARAQRETVLAVWVPHLKTYRFTLGFEVLNRAKLVTFLVTGDKKERIVKAVLEAPTGEKVYPVQLIQPIDGEVIWLLDMKAAEGLAKKDVA